MRLVRICWFWPLLLFALASHAATNSIPRETVQAAETLLGLDFSDAKIDMMLPGLKGQLADYQAIRAFPLSNSVFPALQFNPLPNGFKFETVRKRFRLGSPGKVRLPVNADELAFYS